MVAVALFCGCVVFTLIICNCCRRKKDAKKDKDIKQEAPVEGQPVVAIPDAKPEQTASMLDKKDASALKRSMMGKSTAKLDAKLEHGVPKAPSAIPVAIPVVPTPALPPKSSSPPRPLAAQPSVPSTPVPPPLVPTSSGSIKAPTPKAGKGHDLTDMVKMSVISKGHPPPMSSKKRESSKAHPELDFVSHDNPAYQSLAALDDVFLAGSMLTARAGTALDVSRTVGAAKSMRKSEAMAKSKSKSKAKAKMKTKTKKKRGNEDEPK